MDVHTMSLRQVQVMCSVDAVEVIVDVVWLTVGDSRDQQQNVTMSFMRHVTEARVAVDVVVVNSDAMVVGGRWSVVM